MPLIQILNYSQKKEFESPPALEEKIQKEIFTIPLLMQRELETFENDSNKSIFIALYGYFKLTRTFYDTLFLSSTDLAYIQKQYSFVQSALKQPSQKTIIRYKKIIREHFGYISPDENLKQKLLTESMKLIAQLSTPKAVFYALVESAIAYRYEGTVLHFPF